MKPLILAFLSKRGCRFFVCLIVLLASLQLSYAQPDTIKYTGAPGFCPGGFRTLTADPAPAGATYQWRRNGTQVSTATSYNANVAGTYTVTVNGNLYPTPLILTAFSNPISNYTFTPNSQCSAVPVSFTSTSTGNGPLTYLWNFNDPNSGVNNTSTIANPVHRFSGSTATGNQSFSVSLTVTSADGCTNTRTQTITVVKPSTQLGGTGSTTYDGKAYFTICSSATSGVFSFINQSTTSNTGYKIIWGDGSPDFTATSFTSVTHTYSLGTNTILFIVSNNSCTDTATYYAFVGSNPEVSYGTPGNSSICTSSSLTFPISGVSQNPPGTTYTVTFNDGSSPQTYQHPPPASITHPFITNSCGFNTPSYANSFSTTMVASNPCRTSQVIVSPIYVSDKPNPNFTISPNDTVCVNNITTFSATGASTFVNNGVCTSGKIIWSIFPSTGWSYSFGAAGNDFGFTDPSLWQSGSINLGITFNTPGTYSIKLKAGNPVCGLDSLTRTICVNPTPIGNFTLDNIIGCVPFTVAATNASSTPNCGGNTYTWSVGYAATSPVCTPAMSQFTYLGGTSSTSANPQFQFINPGIYTISLVTKSSGGACIAATVSKTITVKVKPVVTINTLNAICVNNALSPTATVTNCYSTQAPTYNWTFSGGSPATASTLIPGAILYTTISNFPITLTVQNECGVTTATATANITDAPTANAGTDKNPCSGVPTQIGVSTGGNYTYSWSPATGLNNANVATPTATLNYTGPNADSMYTYIVTVSAGSNCSKKDTVNIVVKKGPVITITPPNAAICNGQSVTLIATGATSYVWTPPATLNVSNQDTVIASPPNNTTYTVTGTENGCTATAQASVTVTATVIVNAGPDTLVCNSSTSVQLTGSPTGGMWSGYPNVSPGGVFNPAAAGNGAYTLYYTAGTGNCTRRDSMVVTVVSSATANAGTDSTFCQQPGTIQLTGVPSGGSWSGPLVTPLGVFNTNTPGSYTLIYRIGSGSCIARDTVIITVNNSIANNVISANQTLCAGAQPVTINGQPITGGNGAPQYQWQQSTDSLAWTNITVATGLNYLPPAATQIIYYRRLATTASCTGQTNASLPVKITINPDARAIFNPTSTVGCIPFVITPAIINLTPFNNAVSEYRWFINGFFYSNLQAFLNYTMAVPGDSITIKLVAISRFGCKNDSLQYGFKTVVRPLPAFNQSDSLGCGPLNITFTNQTPNAAQYTYLWNFGNGQTSTLQQPTAITFPVNPQGGDTVYTVRFITFSQCTSDTLIRYVRVKGKPKALFTPDRTTGCSSYNFTFTNTSRSSGVTAYIWDFGDGSPLLPTNAPQVNHVYTVGNTTTFRVKLKATNECGTDSLIYNLVVTPITIRPDFAINGNESFGCLPHTVSFINNSQGGTLYTINFGDGSAPVSGFNGIDTIRHTYTDTGVFVVRLRATNSCSDTTDIEYVTVRRKPIVAFTATPLIGCTGDTIRYNNLSDTGISYNWRFGDGGTAFTRNPTHIYTTGGTFRTWLTGRKTYTGGSCADSAFKDIVIRDTLAGSFTAGTVAATCLPASISFVNDNRPAALTTWTFGDGGTATGDSVNHTYTQAGTYVVKMISRGIAGCTYTATRTINIVGLSGTLQYNSGYLCPGIPLRMEVQSTTATQIRYFFGNGDSLTTTNAIINYTYPQPGVYVPYAYLLSANCLLRLNVGDTVRVDRLRTGFRTAQQQTCGRTTVSFTDTSNAFFGIRSWLWNFGDGTTSTQQNPIHTYTQNGTYQVRLRITGNSNCVDTITIPVTVTVRNFPVSTIAGDTVACIGQPLALSAIVQSADAVASYNWDFGNGTPGTGQNVTAVYNTIGTYTVRLITRTAFGCADTVYKTVRSNNSPIVSAGPDVTICRGQSIQIGAIGATTWQWSPLQGLSCTTCANPVANPLFTNSYIVTGSFGALCRANDTIRVQVIQPFNMTVSPTTTVCIGDSIPLFATGAHTYSWSPALSLNNANLSNPTAKPTITTLYQVIGRDNFNCFTDTDYVRVNVGQYPTVDLGTGATVVAGTTITLNPIITNGPITRYRWTPPTDLSCSNCPRPVATINNNISYKLEAENAFGCIGSDTINFKVNCDPNQLFIPNAFSPDGDGTNDVLMVRGKGISAVKYFRVFNRWGQMVFERSNINVNDAQQGWDGRINGVPAQPDVYVYTAEAVCTAGGTFVYKGNVTLVR